MKSRLTILAAVFLLVALAMPHAAEAQGYNVSFNTRDRTSVVQYGNNQMVDGVRFTYSATGSPPLGSGLKTITVGFGGLMISNPIDPLTLQCGTSAEAVADDCDQDDPTAKSANDDKGVGTVTITIPDAYRGTDNNWFAVTGIRLDVSALPAKGTVNLSITSSATGLTPIGQGTGGAITDVLATVEPGLTVAASQITQLACSRGKDMPAITLTEGFEKAWEGPIADTDATWRTNIRIELTDLPDMAVVTWPDGKPDGADGALEAMQTVENTWAAGTTLVRTSVSAGGRTAVYQYMRKADDSGLMKPKTASFKIKPKIDFTKVAGDTVVGISARLWPSALVDEDGKKTDLATQLSYNQPPMTPEKNGADWLVISDCVTYLLYPFVTCEYSPGWTTGISVSNTSPDRGVFGPFDNLTGEDGPVTAYGFAKGMAADAMPLMTMVSSNLAAGDTVSFTCSDNSVLAGMEGYLVIKAGFQNARGMGFVLGNFSDGAAYDVSHGYVAEVIGDGDPRTRADITK